MQVLCVQDEAAVQWVIRREMVYAEIESAIIRNMCKDKGSLQFHVAFFLYGLLVFRVAEFISDIRLFLGKVKSVVRGFYGNLIFTWKS